MAPGWIGCGWRDGMLTSPCRCLPVLREEWRDASFPTGSCAPGSPRRPDGRKDVHSLPAAARPPAHAGPVRSCDCFRATGLVEAEFPHTRLNDRSNRGCDLLFGTVRLHHMAA